MASKKKKKELMTKSSRIDKNFKYQKNEVTLDFTLRIDNSSQLRDFKECLEAAIVDIDELVSGMKN